MEKDKRVVLSLLFSSIAILLGEDLISDLIDGATIFHVLEEIIVVSLVAFGFVYIWKDNFSLKADLSRAQRELEKAKKESQEWIQKNKSLAQGLAVAIDSQMEKWHLTVSEKEIAQLLIKGLSMKEIAEVRKTAERTVRQQSLSVYEKSGLSGRAELSAFFLEDLF